MEGGEDDDDLKLVKASVGLLADLESDLPKLLWKQAAKSRDHLAVHTRVRRRDLDRLVHLIEPFQGEPQLLDAKLKAILPPIVRAYLEYLPKHRTSSTGHANLEIAISTLLYTFCKVRGQKVVAGFLSNEPRYLEPILAALERIVQSPVEDDSLWQVAYVLLLWLSHLLLTPFDLTTISTAPCVNLRNVDEMDNFGSLPPLTSRVLQVGLIYLASPTKAQDSAASMLVRLTTRPDVENLRLADRLLHVRLQALQGNVFATRNTYDMLGTLRFVAGVASSPELEHLVPRIYETCSKVFDENDDSTLTSNAVAKKLIVKIFRKITVTSLRSLSSGGQLLDFIEATDVLENIIDYLLRSLSDKDTPVRYAAAKAISTIVLELETSMSHEVIQAVLDGFQEDMPRSASVPDFTMVNALKWHGLALTLSHALFKRSAAPEQLRDILDALINALQFQQRTAVGSNLGTNVRDAANFGLWSLSRRYATTELLSISISSLSDGNLVSSKGTVIEVLAVQLILSACVDPAGNIRRGSSAALQELVGRHPDEVYHGISLVQIVDYQAVSLRARAMIDVANQAATLHPTYWQALLDALFDWRGLGSADVPSREAAATSIARLATSTKPEQALRVLSAVTSKLRSCPLTDLESLHGLTLTAAAILESDVQTTSVIVKPGLRPLLEAIFPSLAALKEFSPRALRSEVTISLAKLLTALCHTLASKVEESEASALLKDDEYVLFNDVADRLLGRREDRIMEVVPGLVQALYRLHHARSLEIQCIEPHTLSVKIGIDSSKSSLNGAGRAIALGVLAPIHGSLQSSNGVSVEAVTTLTKLFTVANVDWRVIGARALLLALGGAANSETIHPRVAEAVSESVHQGLNDFTIDERGDVGSLVRLQCISCVSMVMSMRSFLRYQEHIQLLQSDIVRLSMEKLDRVRLKAAQCRKEFFGLETAILDVASVSSTEYLGAAMSGLTVDAPAWMHKALLEGCTSCAGVGAEPLLQASRHVLASYLASTDEGRLERLLTIFIDVMRDMLVEPASTQAGLELLAFLLDMQIPQRLSASTTFRWRTLLSMVQKLHHKSNDIPKITAAIHVYVGLVDVLATRDEVLKKLIGMLKTNPYPRVRAAVAEALWVSTGDALLKERDWTQPVARNAEIVEQLQRRHIAKPVK